MYVYNGAASEKSLHHERKDMHDRLVSNFTRRGEKQAVPEVIVLRSIELQQTSFLVVVSCKVCTTPDPKSTTAPILQPLGPKTFCYCRRCLTTGGVHTTPIVCDGQADCL